MKAHHVGKKVTFRNYEKMYDIIDYVVEKYPEKGFSYINISGEEEFLSYAEVSRQSLCYLDTLQKKGLKKGDIVIVETASPMQYHLIFWACVYGGIIVCPMSQPNSWEIGTDSMKAIEKMWKKVDKPVIITDSDHVKYYSEMQKTAEFEGLEFISIDEFTSDSYGVITPTESEEIAYIQFSSGTTGDPKGTKLSYHNIIYTCRSMADCLAFEEDDISISWLPHTHNLGVFIPLVITMMFCNSGYFMTPATFIGNPNLFVKKISEHRCSWLCINNFGIDWMAKQVDDEVVKELDFSCLKAVLAGAENISKSVIGSFLKKYEPANIQKLRVRPGYGLSETTLAVTITAPLAGNAFESISRKEIMINGRAVATTDESDSVHLTGNGIVLNGIEMRIVNEDGETLEEHEIGEIQVFGDCLFQGYYGMTKEELNNMKDGWLATGDLGFFSEGVLFIVGRKKDVVIIRGVNYLVADLEDIIYKKIERPRGTLALTSVMNKETNTEEIIVFIQTGEQMEEFVKVRKKVIESINENLALSLSLVLPVEKLDKTSSGKIQRYVMKMKYENGFYQGIKNNIERYVSGEEKEGHAIKDPETENEAIVRDYWASALKRDASKISTDIGFTVMGGNSVQAYQILQMITKHFNNEFGHDLLMKCRTIQEMAQYIEKHKDEEEAVQDAGRETTQKVADEIVITGLAFRLPGATTQDQLWSNLCEGKDCITRISDARKEIAEAPDWDNWLGELDGVANFDHDFFDISEQEALFMDPQQRLILEVSYEALEDAGIVTDNYDEEKMVGVYAGLSSNSYFPLVIDYVKKNGIDSVDPNALIGNLNNITAARISHLYNFTGPVVAMDTACSSFCVSLHHATQAIRNGQAEGAVVASANVLSVPYIYALAKKAGIISSTNQSKVFDENADGSILGEGVIVVYLEKLGSALKNNKNVYGVIKGSAINNDGFALSVMSPNPKGQFEVMKAAYASTDVKPSDVSYIEAHGTGTKIGDPIEMNALSRMYSPSCKEAGKRISIGSVKTNIGHLLAAAGGASLTKVLLCLKNKELVPSIHMESVNPLLEIEKTPFDIVTERKEWKVPINTQRIAGICSLGLGGTNAHIIVGEYQGSVQAVQDDRPQLLTISAKTEEALKTLVQKTQKYIDEETDSNLYNLCLTRNKYRRHYEYRASCILDKENRSLEMIETGRNTKVMPSKVTIALGDIRKNGTEQEFEEWAEILECLKKSLLRFNGFVGEKSGKILADYLSGKKDKETAKEEYFKNVVEECEISFENETVPDILFCIGVDCASMPRYNTKKNVNYMNMTEEMSKDRIVPAILQKLYLVGANFNWDVFYPDGSGKLLTLPTYPFHKETVWIKG